MSTVIRLNDIIVEPSGSTLTINSGNVNITNNSNSTSSSTGALIVTGGIATGGSSYFQGSLNVTDMINITNSSLSTSTSTGALVVSGGIGVGGNAFFSQGVHFSNDIIVEGATSSFFSSTASTSSTTGALVVAGGIGIGGNSYFGGTLNVSGITSITNSTASTSTSTGALVVSGGIGVAGDVYLGSSLNTVSDIRMKKIIRPLENCLSKINSLNCIVYSRTDKPSSSPEIGLIAQEVKHHFPEIIKEDSEGYLSMDYTRLTSVIIKAIQELYEEVKLISKSSTNS